MNVVDQLKEILNYDPETGHFTWSKPRRGVVGSNVRAGSVNTHRISGKSYILINTLGKQRRAHRLAWMFMTGEECPTQIDHIDGNGLNNAWSNLRATDNQGNSRNKRLYSVNKTGVTGVGRHKKANKWIASIKHNGKNVHLGLFVDFDEAVKARKDAEVKYGYHINHGSDRPL